MKRYRVSLCFTARDDYIIEAENESEALDKAQTAYEQGHGAIRIGAYFREPDSDEVREED